MADEVEARLDRMRRAMVKMRREGRQAEFDALVVAYEALKAEHVERVHEERRQAARARRAPQRAVEEPVRAELWRLPRGFASPLAAERARSGWRPREEPVVPAGALSPWRRGGSPMGERIWRPGR
ncbi:hypothetical protein [Streptomyces sp. A012304]|uniref:hypothetical protein n=1 Tax=Streptomyces sp. A012304 TaxID=375446 RepID=UPI00223150C8|nr:hypothetical protein [Streptomyces sp. A012304]GKQ37184.1 hypothetical protein ALMP_37230 [Streptomyces sp. A012304]